MYTASYASCYFGFSFSKIYLAPLVNQKELGIRNYFFLIYFILIIILTLFALDIYGEMYA